MLPFLFFKQFLEVQFHISTSMSKSGQQAVSQRNSHKYMMQSRTLSPEEETDIIEKSSLTSKPGESVLLGQLNSSGGHLV